MTRKATATATAPSAQQSLTGNDNGGAPEASTGAALATASQGGGGLATVDELDGLDLGDDADDGLGEVDRDDVRIAALAFNVKRTGKDGRAIPPDVFYNTVDEHAVDHVDAAFLLLNKTNQYARFDNSKNENETICRSSDRVTGTMHDGTKRPCEGCPDTVWYTNGEGKRACNCAVVYNVFGVDRATEQLFVIRFKKTSLGAIKSHLQKHHIGRRVVGGKRSNYPLYAFGVKLTLKMVGTKITWAVPVIERTGVLSPDMIRMCAESTKVLHEQVGAIVERAEQAVDAASKADHDGAGGGAADTNFDYGANVGEDFVPAGDGGDAEKKQA